MRADEACAPGDQGPAGFAVHGRERIEAVAPSGCGQARRRLRRTARSATSASLVCGDPVEGLSARSLLRMPIHERAGVRFAARPPPKEPTDESAGELLLGRLVGRRHRSAAHTNSCGRGGAPPPGAAASLT
jgi:hypothetical protein